MAKYAYNLVVVDENENSVILVNSQNERYVKDKTTGQIRRIGKPLSKKARKKMMNK